MANSQVFAGDAPFAVSKIPPGLAAGARAVKRMENYEFRIESPKRSRTRLHYAITIFNSGGHSYSDFSGYYDGYTKIQSFEGRLYDASGKQIKTIRAKDLTDRSAVGDAFMADTRIKEYTVVNGSYPFTIEYDLEFSSENMLFFPYWTPQNGAYLAIESASFSITAPSDYQLRYRPFRLAAPVETKGSKEHRVQWTIDNLPAFREHPASPSIFELAPNVAAAPSLFELEGMKGDMNSWSSLGQFFETLNAGRQELPASQKEQVRDLVRGITNKREVVEKLYRYMQQHTRYVSIQLGIGGWQPFKADFVSRKGYGDCKALVNFMRSLLSEAGINSLYTLVNSGNLEPVNSEFPSARFNHVILCVPMETDSLWLECTSQTITPGYLGSSTENRAALIVNAGGSRLIRTPALRAGENSVARKISATVSPDGSMKMKTETIYRGIRGEWLWGSVERLGKERMNEMLQQNLALRSYEVESFNYSEVPGVLPCLREILDVDVDGYARISGKRLFLPPNILSRSRTEITAVQDRKADFVFIHAYSDSDEYEVILPEGYTPESKPSDVNIVSPYGSYKSSVVVQGTRLVYKRVFERYAGRFPATQQDAVISFFEDVYDADRTELVLIKKQASIP